MGSAGSPFHTKLIILLELKKLLLNVLKKHCIMSKFGNFTNQLAYIMQTDISVYIKYAN